MCMPSNADSMKNTGPDQTGSTARSTFIRGPSPYLFELLVRAEYSLCSRHSLHLTLAPGTVVVLLSPIPIPTSIAHTVPLGHAAAAVPVPRGGVVRFNHPCDTDTTRPFRYSQDIFCTNCPIIGIPYRFWRTFVGCVHCYKLVFSGRPG